MALHANEFTASLAGMSSDPRRKRPFYVYALIDPRSGKVHYIGCTINAQRREYNHRNPHTAPKLVGEWASGLANDGLEFIFAVLETINGYEAAYRREQELIRLYRKAGAPLFNGGPNSRHVRQHMEPKKPVVSFSL